MRAPAAAGADAGAGAAAARLYSAACVAGCHPSLHLLLCHSSKLGPCLHARELGRGVGLCSSPFTPVLLVHNKRNLRVCRAHTTWPTCVCNEGQVCTAHPQQPAAHACLLRCTQHAAPVVAAHQHPRTTTSHRRGRPWSLDSNDSSSGDRQAPAPRAAAPTCRAYSRMPSTLLWFEVSHAKRLPLAQGNVSPSSLSAPVPERVNTSWAWEGVRRVREGGRQLVC